MMIIKKTNNKKENNHVSVVALLFDMFDVWKRADPYKN